MTAAGRWNSSEVTEHVFIRRVLCWRVCVLHTRSWQVQCICRCSLPADLSGPSVHACAPLYLASHQTATATVLYSRQNASGGAYVVWAIDRSHMGGYVCGSCVQPAAR